jgi:predicted lipid-binding transport protein (Tim44 family)
MTGTVLELVFLAAIAAFVFFRLFSVLGKRTGNEPPPYDPRRIETRRPVQAKDDNVVPLPPRAREMPPRPVVRNSVMANVAPGSALALGVDQIRETDSSFDPDAFVGGAKVAHEMIARAYADGDRQALKPLLGEDVFASFDAAIAAREKAGHKIDFSFVGLKQTSLVEAGLRGRIAEVTVRFVSELISATRDAAGAVIDGAAGVVREVTDVWTFARDTRSGDPNWKLVATAGAA